MNIEEAVEYLKNCLNDKYNFKNATRKKDKEAIETLLTAYKKEKEKNKLLQDNYSSAHEDINWFCENYISKDKIKKYIHKIQKELDKYKIKNTNTYIQIEGNPEIDGLLIQKETLKELIKEE